MAKKNEKLSRSEAGKARWAALSPAEKAKVKARLAKARQARASGQPAEPKAPRTNPKANGSAAKPERTPAAAKGIALPTTPRGHFVLVHRDGNRGTSCEVFAKRADAEAAAGRCRAGVVLQVDSNWA